MSMENPFDSELALRQSRYYGTKGGRAVLLSDPEGSPDLFASAAVGAFRGFVLDPQFSCVGAKSAVMHVTYRSGVYGQIAGVEATAGLRRDLFTFTQEIASAGEGDFVRLLKEHPIPTAMKSLQAEAKEAGPRSKPEPSRG